MTFDKRRKWTVAMTNSLILLLSGAAMGFSIGALFGYSVIKQVVLTLNVDAGIIASFLGSLFGAIVTVLFAVFIGTWKDRRAAAVAAKAAVAACNFTLVRLNSAAAIKHDFHNFKGSLIDAVKSLSAAHEVIMKAANSGELHPNCAEAGFAAIDALSSAIRSLNPDQPADEVSFSTNNSYMKNAIFAVTAFRDKAKEEGNLLC